MSYQLARLHDDGRLTSIRANGNYPTIEELKATAPSYLAGRRGGGKIVVVQILEVAIPSADVTYQTFGKAMNR